mmetsp:Transcript_3064/g.3385  ORF Transcript_3064/g.3385 Transcript_3064/m.3385 type:complete len:116 (+) Transcript_3064:485-832(+)
MNGSFDMIPHTHTRENGPPFCRYQNIRLRFCAIVTHEFGGGDEKDKIGPCVEERYNETPFEMGGTCSPQQPPRVGQMIWIPRLVVSRNLKAGENDHEREALFCKTAGRTFLGKVT